MRLVQYLAKMLQRSSSMRRSSNRRIAHVPRPALVISAERLEVRTLLTGSTEADHDHDGHYHDLHPAETKFVIPEVTRLQNFDGFLSGPRDAPAIQVAFDFLRDRASDFGLTTAEIESHTVTDQYVSQNGVSHIFLQQVVHEIPVANATISINVAPAGEVINATSSFVAGLPTGGNFGGVSAGPSLDSAEALKQFAEEFGYSLDSAPTIAAIGELFADDEAVLLSAPGFV